MKKYILLVVSALALAFTSCSDSEEIEIIEYGAVTFEVNTKSMYDEFDITDDIKDIILRDRNYTIAVKSFIYDGNGCLMDSMTTYSENTNSTLHNYQKLPLGQYTAIFIETVVSVENDYQPYYYKFVGVDKLSTLKIQQIGNPYWYAAVGVQSCQFSVFEQQVRIVPKALGSIINCYFFNFMNSKYLRAGIGTRESYTGYKLDPSIQEENRYDAKLDDSGIFSLLGYSDVESNMDGCAIYVLGKTLSYNFYFQDEEKINTSTWTCFGNDKKISLNTGEQTYAACAYDRGNDYFYYYYGKTVDELLNWYEGLDLGNAVKPTKAIVPEVNTSWGSTVSSVQSSMNGYSMSIGKTGRAILQNSGVYAITYNGKDSESMIAYFFTAETTGLFEADVMYSKSDVDVDEIIEYLNNNHTYIMEDAGMYMYCSDDFETYIFLYGDDDTWYLAFIDPEYLSSSSAMARLPKFKLPEKTVVRREMPRADKAVSVSVSNVKDYALVGEKNIRRK